jgi:amino acid adenylation domain-containing protein
LEMMIGLLGIWKAGGAYLPLDPAYPKERLGAIMEDSQMAVLLTQRRLLDRYPSHKAQIVYLDKLGEQFVQESAANPVSNVTAQNLAYVIYTSGSTGTPKGVMIEHKSLLNYLWWLKESPLVNKTESIPLITRLTFDASLKQLFVPLLQSRPVWILSDDVINRPSDLLKTLITRNRVGLNCVPSLWSALLDAIDSSRPIMSTEFLSSVFLGGERFNNSLIDRTLAALPNVELWNLYGPTEATANAIVGKIRHDQPISLGRPIANTQIYILDAHLQPAPVGIPGEIYIGGVGVARGYLNRPELNNEKFISNPFSHNRCERLFKTGDLARYMPDGNIEFLGRLDNQIKIRGFRIELGEIEAVLNQHPGLRGAVVTAREDVPGEKRLVAYIVPNREPAPAIRELRSFLKEKLPDYMVPSAYVLLDSLPVTLNGKVDRRALADLGGTEQQGSTEYVAPRDETERVLTRVWSEALNLDRVGIDDDFFALGGHSLLAAKLFTRLDEEFGQLLPLSVLLSAPTIRSLAEHYRRVTDQEPNLSLVALRTTGTLPPIYAVPGMFGNVVGFAELAKELGADQPFYGLQSIGLDGARAPLDSIEEMAQLYIREIRSVQSRGPYSLIGACFGATVAYEMARQLLDQGEKVTFLGLLDPTDREGNVESKNDVYLPRAFKRSLALSSLLTGRLRLYRDEMWKLRGHDRRRYIGCKLGSLTGLVRTNRLMGTKRELNQIEVYQANLRALNRYHRRPLRGCLKALNIFETTRPDNENAHGELHPSVEAAQFPPEPIDWNAVWSGPTQRHFVPGKDSGDMLTGKNVRIVAALLAQQLAIVLEKSVTAIEPELTLAPA